LIVIARAVMTVRAAMIVTAALTHAPTRNAVQTT
jgi:hypothetical protein